MNNSEIDQLIVNDLRDKYLFSRQSYWERNRHSDNIVMWLVGISTGAIAIMTTGSDKLPWLMNKLTLAAFLATIIGGVLYRLFRYNLEIRQITRLTKQIDDLSEKKSKYSLGSEQEEYYKKRMKKEKEVFDAICKENKIGPYEPQPPFLNFLEKLLPEGRIKLICNLLFLITSIFFVVASIIAIYSLWTMFAD